MVVKEFAVNEGEEKHVLHGGEILLSAPRDHCYPGLHINQVFLGFGRLLLSTHPSDTVEEMYSDFRNFDPVFWQ